MVVAVEIHVGMLLIQEISCSGCGGCVVVVGKGDGLAVVVEMVVLVVVSPSSTSERMRGRIYM